MSRVEEEVREYIAENFILGEDGEGLADDDSFLDAGIIDSTGVLELVGFLEENYGIEIGDDEITPENLDSIAEVATFVRGKKRVESDS